MNRLIVSLAKVIGAVSVVLFTGLATAADAPHDVLARYPNGSYLENLHVTPGGDVLFTSYFAKRVERWDGRAARTFASLNVHPVNLVGRGDGFVVLAHGGSFLKGPSALRGSNQLLHLDARGKIQRRVALTPLVFGNGMAWLDKGHLLITDSVLGRIWQVDVDSGSAQVWLESELLKLPPGQQAPAANGLRLLSGTVYVTNSATRKLYTLAVSGGRPAGELVEQPAELPGIDDVAVDGNGTVYIATHRHQVLAFDGKTTRTLLSQGVEGCTSVALSPDGTTLYVLGTGGLFEGQKDEAALVAIRLNPAVPTSHTLDLGAGARLAYLRQGSGPAVVIVHGIGGHKEDWRGVMAALASTHRVYAVDMLGFGGSSKDLAEITVPRQAEALVQLMRAEGLARASVIGNSVGGWVAATFAARNPALLERLVLVDAAGFKAMFDGPSPVNFNPSTVEEMQKLLQHVLASDFAHSREFAEQALKAYRASGDAVATETVFKGLFASPRLEELMPRIQAPTLVIWGREDGLFPLPVSDLIAGGIVGARKLVIDRASHFPQVDQPEAFNAAVLDFLR